MFIVSSHARRRGLAVGLSALAVAAGAAAADAGNLINGDSLLVTTTTYEDVGEVAGLVPGVTQIPGGTAVSGGNINTVWNNETVDASFGVTSPLTIEDLGATNAKVLATETLPTSQIVTSFSSKSELGHSIAETANGPVATFMGYAPGGPGFPTTASGMLDVSASDNTAYVDPTNPVTQFFGSSYAFNRSVVAVSANGSFTITPTLAYGGDNSRAAGSRRTASITRSAIPTTEPERRLN